MKEIEKIILNDLNDEQIKAVINISNPLRILAGAGSGKTKVLTRKIAYLIEVIGIKPNEIIALTFTNKAANEMRSRVEEIIGQKTENMIISTFHSLCYKFLKIEINSLKKYSKDFLVIDSIDQDNVLKEIYKKENIDKKVLSFFSIKEFISLSKNNFVDIDKLKNDIKSIDKNDLDYIKKNVFIKYCEELEKSKALDFDDLLIYTKKILEENESIREKWQNKFKYFLIDEFQDTSKIQYDIISLISKNKNITIVGDPDQTIYTWRGADISFINNFDKLYEDVLTITLRKNYRSTKNILNAANNLILHNSNRIPKELITDNEEGDNVHYYEATSQENESKWVVLQINKLKRQKNQLKDIAILYRSNFYSRSIEDALFKESISYKVINGQKFYERSEIKNSLAFLKCLQEPNDISLKRIINIPSRKLGETTLNYLIDFANQKKLSLWNSWIKHFNELSISYEKKQNLFKFIETIRKYNEILKRNNSFGNLFEDFLHDIGYFKLLEQSNDSTNDRLENVKELIKSIKKWENENKDKNINDYLDSVSLESMNIEDSTNINYISLMTIHGAKGLEFKNVFVIGLVEGVFPSMKSIINDDENGEGNTLEEERRLAYVAFTRAKEKLFLSSTKELYGNVSKNNSNKISRFIMEADIETYNANRTAELILESKISKQEKNFEPGDKIMHINFGEGIVLDINGDSIIINFINKDVGVKQLLKNHKSIEKVN